MGPSLFDELRRLREDVDCLTQQQVLTNVRHAELERRHTESERRHTESERRHTESERRLDEIRAGLDAAHARIDGHTSLFQAESERWFNVRHRTFLFWARDKNEATRGQRCQIAEFNVLVHGPMIAMDARMFEVKGLKEFALFESLYSCSVPMARRLATDALDRVLDVLNNAANYKMLRDVKGEDMTTRQHELFADITSCLRELNPKEPIPAAEVERLNDMCDAYEGAVEMET
ncbi:uncharacterized protein DSM5745_07244 [Aspergillus mulundensis]|uniref:Uncharacterized protein n=1 Tax=Aspergillus mulundensis TaxID=1810919 RepID=A0A3D8RKJ5_9EURO|nr:hypothetical protein DSM5745_07244 [Aspergillus mulundensis]RDW74582.1 hypothetical protein DSM5745_07244 [Aspergillus mulundensis]